KNIKQITFDDCVFGDDMLCFTASDFEESKIRVKITNNYESEVNDLSENLQKYFFELGFVLENYIRGIRRYYWI
ncbi:hypothetical protein CWI37_0738p0020, partial [Hamiltosporidium tvaerminnensis]